MSTLLDEETVVLDGLDFEPPCNYGGHSAVVSVQCRGCGHGALFCQEHADEVRASVERLIESSASSAVMCGKCMRIAFTFDELVKVVPL